MTDLAQPPRPLKGRDLKLYRLGIGLLIAAIAVLGLLLFVYIGVFHADFLTFDGALEAAGATLGSIATTLAAIGSALLFVVSLRVQMRELQHSVEEMKNSVDAQKEAAANHKQALVIAQQQVLIAKQEKEFNVITGTISEVRLHIEGIKHQTAEGVTLKEYHAMQRIIDGWIASFKNAVLEDPGHKWLKDELVGINPGVLLPHYASLEELLIKLSWLSSASVSKSLDNDDRRYLWARINPLVDNTKNALGQINRLEAHLGALANDRKPTDRIHEMQQGLAHCWRLVDDLAKRINELKRPVVGL